MKIFTNKDIRNLFLLLSGISGFFIILLQVVLRLKYGKFCPVIFLLSVLSAFCMSGGCFLYFIRQNRLLESAVSQINLYLSGNTVSRIECNQEGSLYQLFHSVNTLTAVMDAQVTKEQDVKEFLKNTISDISHQLKTPIAALNIYNGLLEDTEDISSIREFAARSEQELDRMETLVQNLLKITKLDAKAIIIEKKQENLWDIIDEIRQHFQFRTLKEKKIMTIKGSDTTTLFCDRDWMIEAITNIVKNALDHMESGCHVSVQWNSNPAAIQISITDNGCGIHPEDIHHIFKRFYRSRFSKDTQGIGLGLPLAKAIIEAHEGTLTADSIDGYGSTFVISFPNITKV